MKFFNYMNN